MEREAQQTSSPGRGIRAAIYTRVSSEEQAREGFSLAAQERRLRSYAESQDWAIADIYVDDGRSGRNTERPAYQKMMKEIDEWDVLLVMKMDRIHRNSRNFMKMMDCLNRNGRDFASATENLDTSTAMGRFVMDIIQRIAQLESEQIGERVKMGMLEKARSEKGWFTRPPLGYDMVNGQLQVNAEEARIVRWIFEQYRRGLTEYAITQALNDRGAKTKRGRPWQQGTIGRILRNPAYLGIRIWAGEVMANNHEAIVARRDFLETREEAKKRARGSALRQGAVYSGSVPGSGEASFDAPEVGAE